MIRWDEIPHILEYHKKVVRPVKGNGFCIMESIQEALNADHNIQVPIDVMVEKIIEELLENPEYTRYYKTPYTQQDLADYIKRTVNTTEHGEKMATMFIPPLATAMNIEIKYFKNYKNYYCQNSIKPINREDEEQEKKTIFLLFTGEQFHPLVCEGAMEETMAETVPHVYLSPGTNPHHSPPVQQDPTEDMYISPGSLPYNSTPVQDPSSEDLYISPGSPQIISSSSENHSIQEVSVFTSSESEVIGRGKAFDMSIFQTIPPKKVDMLPHDINGRAVYCININDGEDYKKKYLDGRYFKLTNTSRKGFEGERKIGKCQGNLRCTNPQCPFVKESGNQNTHQFTGRKDKFCFSCNCLATKEKCGAIKCIEYDRTRSILVVYHEGIHKCTPKPQKSTSEQDKAIEEALAEHGHLGPKEICKLKLTQEVKKQMKEGAPDKEKIKGLLNTFNDRERVSKAKRKMEQATKNEVHSLAAVAELKEYYDPFDKYYIFEINDGSMNDKPSYVFKSSKEMGEMMMKMDQNSEDAHPLQDEVVYFDGMHKRCSGYKTLTLWVLQITQRKLTRLATMEVKRENTENCALFWQILNKMLAEIKGEAGYKFNPKQFITDEAGAIHAGIRIVYGEEGQRKTKTCQFHYKQCLERAINCVPDELQVTATEFYELAIQLLIVPTMAQYNEVVRRLKMLADILPSVVGNWLEWWLARRYNLFPVFRGFCMSSLNQAEIGHATLKPLKPLFLVDAANEDVVTMLMQEEDNRRFLAGQKYSTGRAPSKAQQAQKQKKEQVKRAREYIVESRQGLNLTNESAANAFIPNKSAKHRLSKNQKGIEGHEVPAPSSSQPRNTEARNLVEDDVVTEEVRRMAPPRYRVKTNNRPHLCLLSLCKQVKKCYGCKLAFSEKQKEPPNDIILRMCLKRDVLINGHYQPGWKKSWCYFHLNLNCVRMENSVFEMADIYIPRETRPTLTPEHMRKLESKPWWQEWLEENEE